MIFNEQRNALEQGQRQMRFELAIERDLVYALMVWKQNRAKLGIRAFTIDSAFTLPSHFILSFTIQTLNLAFEAHNYFSNFSDLS